MIKKYSYSNDKDTFLTPHFQVEEFKSYCDDWGKLTTDDILIDDKLLEILEMIYSMHNCSKIVITSGYRSEDFDTHLGGFVGYHSKGQAADIICYDQDNNPIWPGHICITCENQGVLGIGYGASYTHIDTRDWKSFFDETNGQCNIGSWYDYFGIARPKSTKPEPTPQPQEKSYNIGDTVEINCVYISSTDDNKMEPLITKGTITQIIDGARNPYLLDNGNIGWINNECIVSKIEKSQAIYPGDKVRIKNATQYNGYPFEVYYDVYDVLEIYNDRVVIGIGNTVTCAININNIEKI